MKKRKFGFWSIVLFTINSIIGTGIFVSPGSVVKIAGSYAPLVYVLAACFAGILAVTFASAAKYVNRNGAAYAYAKTAFGDNLGFYIGVTLFTATSIAFGVMATAVVRTSIGVFFGQGAVTFQNITIGFLVLMAILLAILFSGTYVTKIANNISTVGKVAALLIAIVAGFVIWMKTGVNHFAEVNFITDSAGKTVVSPMNTTIFVGAILSAFYAYTGFENVSAAVSEFENPEKTLPIAIPVGIGIVTLVYLLVVTIAMIINPKSIVLSDATVVLAQAYSNPLIKGAITYGAIISMFGLNITAAFSTPHIFESMALQKQLPKFLSKKTSHGVPLYAFLITATAAIAIPMAFRYDLTNIILIASVARFLQFLVVPLAVIIFYFNRSKEEILIPQKTNFITDVIIPFLGFLATLFLLAKFDWVGQFSMINSSGHRVLDIYAVLAMVVGYIILPIALYIPYKSGKYKDN